MGSVAMLDCPDGCKEAAGHGVYTAKAGGFDALLIGPAGLVLAELPGPPTSDRGLIRQE